MTKEEAAKEYRNERKAFYDEYDEVYTKNELDCEELAFKKGWEAGFKYYCEIPCDECSITRAQEDMINEAYSRLDEAEKRYEKQKEINKDYIDEVYELQKKLLSMRCCGNCRNEGSFENCKGTGDKICSYWKWENEIK